MKRLTEKHKSKSKEDIYLFSGDFDIVLEKLGKLEDIEEELGIDLITLFKVFNAKTIYEISKYDNKIHDISGVISIEAVFDRDNKCFTALDPYYNERKHGISCYLHLKDYGKTWAVTREELERK